MESKDTNSNQVNNLNDLLEAEMLQNKNEAWNKLDNASKIKKLNLFAESYCQEDDKLSTLKTFFAECIEKGKLKKVKDVEYDRETGIVSGVPGLLFIHKRFTIKNLEKRVSTMKSLTPKRMMNKNKSVSNKQGAKTVVEICNDEKGNS